MIAIDEKISRQRTLTNDIDNANLSIQEKINTESTIVTNARHYHALQQVLQALQDTQSGLEKKLPSDLIALEIRLCIHYLGEITGEITNEDQLDYIFSKFCIGK